MLPLVAATLLFLVTHSLLAAPRAKRWAEEQLRLTRWYRLLYSLWSTLTLGAVLWLWWRAPQERLFDPPAALTGVGWLLMAGGALLATLAVLRFGASGFLGLMPEADHGLVRSGLHGHMRHPIYTGLIMLLLGWCLAWPTLPTAVVSALMLVYLPVGIHLEERKLVARFGEAYHSYRSEVPMLLPKLGARRT